MKKNTSPRKTVAKKKAVAKPSAKKKVVTKPVVKKKVIAKPVVKKKAVAKPVVKKKAVAKPVAKKKVVAKPAAKKNVVAKKHKLLAKDKKMFLAMLQGLKERHVGQISTLKKESLSQDNHINPEEDGTLAFDRQFSLGLVSSERESLFEIEDALGRLKNSTYGVCEECHELIKHPRLKALPFVRMCIDCQSQKERGKSRFTPMFK